MKLIPVGEFDWSNADLSTHYALTCKNHPTAKYLSKNPYIRGLHCVRFPEGFDKECPCPFGDLVVKVKEESD